ncbi:fungal-specific transcription factor domain-containing protein [Lineolata rhizophorae]|uniref:Fungal-specific transcription factor domain-containing protein n=1 Tax=Lineolata rhizophorae TaxID=578093 RepID=A0A6A6NWD9_9PEZI|nr:fungal-specific transcription factor domain-containing protein [Lineolata rhizophorae]
MSRGTTQSGVEEEAVVYSQTRMLQDPTGRLLYIGDSATLSFLQLVRMMVEYVAGPSSFTTDPRRHRIVEPRFSLPPHARHTHLLPDKRTAYVLVESFFTNTQGLLQIFDRQSFFNELEACYCDPLSTKQTWLCILNLVFAIGLMLASPQPATHDSIVIEKLQADQNDRAEIFYFNAKSFCDPLTGFEDADFWSVQALTLMSVYMLSKSKRNTAFAFLGMAVRSAYALGLHREETLVVFSRSQQVERRNLWRTLFVIDRFLSCSLGRPTAITEDECSGDTLRPSEPSGEDQNGASNAFSFRQPSSPAELGALALEAAVRSCSVIGTILKRVYHQRKISTRLAQEIADVCKQWPRALPPSLHWRQAADAHPAQGVAILHANLFYCHSIVLLTRPFFLYLLNAEVQNLGPVDRNTASGGDSHAQKSAHGASVDAPANIGAAAATAHGFPPSRAYSRMGKFAEACVVASTHTVVLVRNAYEAGYLPRRDPTVVYFLFAAALVLLSNEFAGLYGGGGGVAMDCIDHACTVMASCAKTDEQASRLTFIMTSFRDVVVGTKEKRRKLALELQQQQQQQQMQMLGSPLQGRHGGAASETANGMVFNLPT